MTTITKRERKAARAARDQDATDRAYRETRATLDEMIAAKGYAVCVLTSTDPGDKLPYFAYTVGLCSHGMPELCGRGAKKEPLRDLLNSLPGVARATGIPLEANSMVHLPDGRGALTLSVAPPDMLEQMLYARERYTFVRALVVGRVL